MLIPFVAPISSTPSNSIIPPWEKLYNLQHSFRIPHSGLFGEVFNSNVPSTIQSPGLIELVVVGFTRSSCKRTPNRFAQFGTQPSTLNHQPLPAPNRFAHRYAFAQFQRPRAASAPGPQRQSWWCVKDAGLSRCLLRSSQFQRPTASRNSTLNFQLSTLNLLQRPQRKNKIRRAGVQRPIPSFNVSAARVPVAHVWRCVSSTWAPSPALHSVSFARPHSSPPAPHRLPLLS